MQAKIAERPHESLDIASMQMVIQSQTTEYVLCRYELKKYDASSSCNYFFNEYRKDSDRMANRVLQVRMRFAKAHGKL